MILIILPILDSLFFKIIFIYKMICLSNRTISLLLTSKIKYILAFFDVSSHSDVFWI